MKTQLDDLNRDLRVAEMQLAHAILMRSPKEIIKERENKIHEIKSIIYNIQ